MVIVFLLSAGFVLYVLFGYPLLLDLIARRRARPVTKAFHPMTVSVLLPVHNGEKWIRAKLETLAALDYPRELMEILVLSDGSTDNTARIVQEFAADHRVRLLDLPSGGKAAAQNRGIAEAKGEILFLTDVRQPLGRDALRKIVECFADPRVGVVTGELIILEGSTQEEANVGLYWKYEKWIRKRHSAIDSVLGATGCIFAMRRALAGPMPPGTLLDDCHLPIQAFLKGYRIVMEDTAKAYDYPTSLSTEFHRKVRTQAGIYQLIGEFPALLGPHNRMWLHFLSHRLGRLLLPFALILIAISSFGLPSPWREAALAAQAVFYAAALISPILPERSLLKRLTAPVHTFVVLMAAALCATSVFFVPPERLWKRRS
jgi:cellulose synthase/poly-beta-1,6-N-acetylglucosamine synthase-like glycosyltransferase